MEHLARKLSLPAFAAGIYILTLGIEKLLAIFVQLFFFYLLLGGGYVGG